jgi:hypothetical protein
MTSLSAINSWLIVFFAILVAAQSANTTVNFIAGNLTLVTYYGIEKIRRRQNFMALIMIAFCISALVFTAPWSILLGFLLIMATISHLSFGKNSILIIFVIFSSFALFALFHHYLGVSFGHYIYSNFFFNAFEYPQIVREESGLGLISSIMLQPRLFSASGIPLLLIVFLLLAGSKQRSLFVLINCIFLCCMALLTGSDHVHYSIWLAVALILVIRNSDYSTISSSLAVIVASTLAFSLLMAPTLYSKAGYAGCTLKLKTLGCESPYLALEVTARDMGGNYSHEFLGNDPWPYLLTDQSPRINFASNYEFVEVREVPKRMHVYWVKKSANLQNGLGEFLKSLTNDKNFSEKIYAGDWVGYQLD